MPLYEYYKNAENKVAISDKAKSDITTGTQKVADRIAEVLGGAAAMDGWYGVDWKEIKEKIENSCRKAGKNIEFIHAAQLFSSEEEIALYQKKFITDDPSFGWVNDDGTLLDIMDEDKINAVKQQIEDNRSRGIITFLYGAGAAAEPLQESLDLIMYADFTMQPMLWKMWGGELVPFGKTEPVASYEWKQYYYSDFYLLLRQKKVLFKKMDYYIDAVHSDSLKMMGAEAYNEIIDAVVSQPIKQVKILQPGPWGAYRYKDLWEVEGLECNAWNELAGIELSVLVDVGLEENINMPAQNIMQRPVQVVGEYVNNTYPDLMPLQVWLDDGYFKEEVPIERAAMPIHDHPSTKYVKEHFNEPLGRYETYYIVESYKGSATLMGYKETADLEEWEKLCCESQNQKKIENWQDYVCKWDTNPGDLFLIPPGTSHGHGGNQMILEMDTGPSVAGTEYSFFTFDYARNTWDDDTKTMTAKPMRMHTKHSFQNNKWIRENRVKDTHRARPIALEGDGKYRKDQYTTIPEMPFHIERIYFEKEAVNDTEGKYMQMVTLVEGERVTIRSKKNPELQTTIDRYQACIIPAGFGEHEYVNECGGQAMVVLIRLKKG